MKNILIDCTLTGGRGPAKKAAEFIWECQRLNIPYKLVADERLVGILSDFAIKPDYIIPINFSSTNEEIYDLFDKQLRLISYDVLVKFGARTPGPYVARRMGKPYIIVDGGLPDKYEAYPSLYDKKTYQDAKVFILTSNFPWVPTPPLFLKNVYVAYFPLSQKTRGSIKEMKAKSRRNLIDIYGGYFSAFSKKPEFIINLSMTGDYVDEKSRVTYGAWLKTKEYDQCVGFVRRLITDLGMTGKSIEIITDSKVSQVATDILTRYKNISVVTWKEKWNYEAEIALERIADTTISRAANYQPFGFAFGRGNSVTTVVPSDGYMNEDAAAIQAQGLQLTENIPYDDEQYGERLLVFIKDKDKQKAISNNQIDNFKTFGRVNNSLTVLFNTINSL